MRAAVATLAALVALLVAPGVAGAHPLGNFSVNHETVVSVSRDRIDLTYVLDQAEIPTFQERGEAPAQVLAKKRADVARGVRLAVDGRPLAPAMAPGGEISFPPGQGGLPTTRVTLRLSADVNAIGRTVRVEDQTYPGRIGWKAIVARPGQGTAVRSSVPADDPTGGLRRYPRDVLKDPADLREATLAVRAGDGTVTAPHGRTVTGAAAPDGFAGLLAPGA